MDLGLRFWEVDFSRGIAVSGMIAFHLLYDLNFFHAASIDLSTLPWLVLSRGTASVFVFLVGVSLSLSYARLRIRGKPQSKTGKYLFRGLRILFYGVIISVVTWFFLGDDLVLFGILHLIGLSIILSIPLLDKSPRILFSAGILLASLF
ncbi:MAG: heparan-alpha-glucosaminide N-acetyltransferase domain-containing protein, partial [Candidatus Altiarchaeota archaeon]|nr:heparan-alpha-glucosaminide N-acetyltransferase domain-containing protein [Candidatus Altiarchaeota archaeon]